MFHWFTEGSGIFFSERLHNYRGRDHTHDIDDFADPDFPGARKAAKAAGLPYFRGGKCELGGTQRPLDEARKLPRGAAAAGADRSRSAPDFKKLMRASLLRDRLCGVELIAEDLPYSTNRVDLDPKVRDWRGFPVPRITYGPGPSEIAAQAFYLPWVVKLLKAAGADVAIAVPEIASSRFPIAQDQVPATEHVMGGMPMGTDAAHQCHRRAGPSPPPRQRLRRRRRRLPGLRGAQPHPHDHGDRASAGDALGGRRLKRHGGRREEPADPFGSLVRRATERPPPPEP